MKVKEMLELLRMSVSIEFRVDNFPYCTCLSTDLIVQDVRDRVIEDWFVISSKVNCIVINLKRITAQEEHPT